MHDTPADLASEATPELAVRQGDDDDRWEDQPDLPHARLSYDAVMQDRRRRLLDRFDLMSEEDVAVLCGVELRTLLSWRQIGDGPPFVKLSRNMIAYRRADIGQWIKSGCVFTVLDVLANSDQRKQWRDRTKPALGKPASRAGPGATLARSA